MINLPESLKSGQSFEFREPGHDHLWEQLLAKDPAVVAEAAKAGWLGGHDFVVELLGEKYLFEAEKRIVTGPADRLPPDKRTALSLLNYLNGAQPIELSGRLVPETVLPGGDRFFSGTHALTRQPIINVFGRNGQALLEKAQPLGGQAVESKAGSYSFTIHLLPRIFVQVTLCEEDEEFPAELYFAFDTTAADHVSLGILAALIGLLNAHLA